MRMPSVKVPLVIGTPPISFSSFALVMVPEASVVFTLDSVVFGEECYAWQKGDTMREELEIGEVSGTDLSRHVNATDLSLWVFISLISDVRYAGNPGFADLRLAFMRPSVTSLHKIGIFLIVPIGETWALGLIVEAAGFGTVEMC